MPMFSTDFALQQQQKRYQQAFAHEQHHGLGGGQEQLVQNQNGGNMSFALGGHSQAQPQGFAQSHGGGQGSGMNNRGVSAEALQIMSVLSSIQQKIGQLQAIVPLFNQNKQFSDPIVQQKAAATITQLAQVAANMFPFGTQPHDPQPPSFNVFPQSQAGGGGPPTLPMGSNASSFSDLPALDGAVNSGMGLSDGSVGDRLVDLDVDFQGPNPASLAGQNIGGGQDGNDGSRGTDHDQAAAMGMIGGEVSHLTASHVRSNQGSGDLHEGNGEATGSRGEEDDEGGEDEGDDMLPPGSYDLVEMVAEEILAEHTHFCEICSKGFKRDANLRMHMRGHGDEYKSAVALRAPDKGAVRASTIPRPTPRRYSCPYTGCKRNRKHHKFLPLKTILCVKNHYRRIHCPKILVCRKCNKKKFSVVADLKTHEKHCGCDKWECSCGTTFSRKDKLLGHVSLFVGHTPASLKPSNDGEGTSVTMATPDTAHGGTEMGMASSLHGAAGLGGDENMFGSENGDSSMLQGLFSFNCGVNASSDGLL